MTFYIKDPSLMTRIAFDILKKTRIKYFDSRIKRTPKQILTTWFKIYTFHFFFKGLNTINMGLGISYIKFIYTPSLCPSINRIRIY